jgi:hypothetical protein
MLGIQLRTNRLQIIYKAMLSLYQAYTKGLAGVTEYDRITVPNEGGDVSVSEPLKN